MSANSPIDVNTSIWNIDQAHTVAEFKVKHMMISNVKGQFAKVTGTLNLDESVLENSHVEDSIDVSSLETRDAQRDAHLKSADFFDVEKFPALSFSRPKSASSGPVSWPLRVNLPFGMSHARCGLTLKGQPHRRGTHGAIPG